MIRPANLLLSVFASAALLALPARAAITPALAVATPAPTIAPSSAFAANQLLTELARSVSNHFNLEGDLQLELIRPWTAPKQTAATWQVSIAEFPIMATSTMMLRFQVIGDGTTVMEDSILVRAALFRDSWFARQPIQSGSVFDPSLLEVRKIDCLREHDGLPASAGSSSFVFSRDLPSDRLVTWHDLARRPLVHKGEMVEVVASEGHLSLTMKALALENGAKGDLISVRNPESNKNISATVIDDDRVLIHF